MKRCIIVLILTLLLVPTLAFANEVEELEEKPVKTYELADFSKEPMQGLWLGTGDFVFFNLLGKRHAIRIDLVYKDNAKIVLYPEIENSPMGIYAPIKKDNYLRLDLNKDEVTDMIITLDALENEEGDGDGLFTFKSLVREEQIPETQGLVVSETEKMSENVLLIVAIAIGVLLGLLVVLGTRKKPSSR